MTRRSMGGGAGLRARLRELGFLQPRAREKTLLALCHAGRLHGGLSISLAATPDEVMGPLTAAMGGAARVLRLEDVRGTGPFELHVRTREALEKWEVEGVPGLLHNLNDLFAADQTVLAAALLGEWEDMLQVWCIDRLRLLALLQEPWFRPENRSTLERIAA